MRPIIPLLAVVALLLGGCNAWQTRAEFAPPQSRWNTSQTSVAGANDPPPPIPAQYCYRTLANVDCFTQTEPNRISGYTGSYPDPYSLPQWRP
ncbi:MAG TPA: hypothetical protein VN668_02595 [Stellaceae bacterium]|nr:hypothetical protein [Stellaceae bacterium]